MGHKFIDGNIEIFRKNTANIPLSFNIDITGATVYLTATNTLMGTSTTIPTPILQVSNATHDDPTNGITHIEITPDDSDISAGQYYVDIQIELLSGEKHVVFPIVENEIAYLIVLDHPKE